MSSVRYSGSEEAVQLGDIVTTRVLFLRRKARVVYLPGVSKKRNSLEHHGLRWVGLQELAGPYLAALVDPTTGILDRKVRLLSRGERVVLPDDVDPFIEPGECVDE